MLPKSAIPVVTTRFVTAKVRVEDEEAMQRSLFTLTDSQGLLTDSEEIFFRVPAGQLKLRLAHPGKDIGTLISSSCQQINRQLAYKLNIWEVRISEVSTGSNQLRHTLALALEELAILRKKRRTFTLGHAAHIHLDNVEGLGSFLDIEINPTADDDTTEKMFIRAENLLRRLNIANAALIPHSYLELYLRQRDKCDDESDDTAFSDGSAPSLRSRITTF
ncbi:hypothetical protein GPALN_004962 [Globodera pallida]|nr:hypothetical protein GPALN_004962 [Globodera pallida]